VIKESQLNSADAGQTANKRVIVPGRLHDHGLDVACLTSLQKKTGVAVFLKINMAAGAIRVVGEIIDLETNELEEIHGHLEPTVTGIGVEGKRRIHTRRLIED
jgi:hypothetical protein